MGHTDPMAKEEVEELLRCDSRDRRVYYSRSSEKEFLSANFCSREMQRGSFPRFQVKMGDQFQLHLFEEEFAELHDRR